MSPAWESKDFCVVWTHFEAISSAFSAMLSGIVYERDLLEREVQIMRSLDCGGLAGRSVVGSDLGDPTVSSLRD